MKKRILCLVSLLFLSGCTINYNLTFNSTEIKENVNSKFKTKSLDNEEADSYNSFFVMDTYPLENNTDIKYIKNTKNKGRHTNFSMNYTYDYINFNNSSIMNQCFDNFIFLESEDTYYVNVKGKFYCMYADTIKINITSPYVISESNSESTKNGNYVWTINKKNQENVDIYFKVSKKTIATKTTNFTPLRIAALIIIIVLGLVVLIIKKKMQNNE